MNLILNDFRFKSYITKNALGLNYFFGLSSLAHGAQSIYTPVVTMATGYNTKGNNGKEDMTHSVDAK